jgi:hypothetical protein
VKTLTVDDQNRIRIPEAKPRDKFAYENLNGVHTFTPVKKVEPVDPFPPDHDFGLTPARNRELQELSKASSLKLP